MALVEETRSCGRGRPCNAAGGRELLPSAAVAAAAAAAAAVAAVAAAASSRLLRQVAGLGQRCAVLRCPRGGWAGWDDADGKWEMLESKESLVRTPGNMYTIFLKITAGRKGDSHAPSSPAFGGGRKMVLYIQKWPQNRHRNKGGYHVCPLPT